MSVDCPLTACKVCSACVYSRHEKCAKTVVCPDDHKERRCSCCNRDGAA